MSFVKESHIKEIDNALAELLTLQNRTKAPAILPNQFIGTVIDNTVCLLTAPGNSLDKGNRQVSYDKDENWVSAMQAVHRSFYSSVHMAIEKALSEFCKERSVTVESSIRREYEKEYEKIKGKLNGEGEILVDRFFEKIMKGIRPNFYDYLQTALDISPIEKEQKKMWRKFFDALTIVRNKSAHSDPSLTDNEAQRLKDGGYGVLASADNQLQINPRNYYQVAFHTLDFFDELTKT